MLYAHFFVFFYDFPPLRMPPIPQMCMQPNQSANICILIMWLLRLNSHHKFHLCFCETFRNPSQVCHKEPSERHHCVCCYFLCMWVFVHVLGHTHIHIHTNMLFQCVSLCTYQLERKWFSHRKMVSWRMPQWIYSQDKRKRNNTYQI